MDTNKDNEFLQTQFPGKDGSDIYKNDDEKELQNILSASPVAERDEKDAAEEMADNAEHNKICKWLTEQSKGMKIGEHYPYTDVADLIFNYAKKSNMIGWKYKWENRTGPGGKGFIIFHSESGEHIAKALSAEKAHFLVTSANAYSQPSHEGKDAESPYCKHCGARKRLKGDGTIEPLCTC